MVHCDRCGGEIKIVLDVVRLNAEFRTDDVQHLCQTCMRLATEEYNRITMRQVDERDAHMREWINRKPAEPDPATRLSRWLRSLFDV